MTTFVGVVVEDMTDKLQWSRLQVAWRHEESFTPQSQEHLERAERAFLDEDRVECDRQLTHLGF